MSFRSDALEALDATREVVIETRAGGRTFRTVVWVVVDDGEVFVRSVRGDTGRWYQRALADPAVTVHAEAMAIPAVAVPAADPASVGRASDALRRKYPTSGSLASMLRPGVLGTTMRLEPA